MFSLAVFVLAVGGLVAAILALTVLLNPRRPGQTGAQAGIQAGAVAKHEPYECGVVPTGGARFRYPAPFWLVAVFFLLFDVEAVYIFTWAVSFTRLDWAAWLRISFFIAVLAFGLAWIWRKGGLEWGVTPRA